VLYLEQLLTTGGGWQDQCGGLYGGAKKSSSDTGLPVKINKEQLGIYIANVMQAFKIIVYSVHVRVAFGGGRRGAFAPPL